MGDTLAQSIVLWTVWSISIYTSNWLLLSTPDIDPEITEDRKGNTLLRLENIELLFAGRQQPREDYENLENILFLKQGF